MKMLLRPVEIADIPAIKKMLQPWIESDPAVLPAFEDCLENGADSYARCRVVETDRTLRCCSLWRQTGPDRIRLLAFGLANGASESRADIRLLQDDIRQWSEMRIAKAKTRVPENLGPMLIDCLRACGFIAEGVVSNLKGKPRIRLCKHFMYRTVPHAQVMTLLYNFFVSMGYEIKEEEDGFGYRVRNDLRRPFIFSTWHRISRRGPEIIMHPPARKLQWHELETLFYPLAVRGPREKPLLLPLEKATAQDLLELPSPRHDTRQESLFNSYTADRSKEVQSNSLIYCYPTGLKHLRRGLPLMFYVKRMGAVGTARLAQWAVDEPRNLYNRFEEMSLFDPEDVKDQAGSSGPNAGKVLVIRFDWYSPLKKVVSFEEIRGINSQFNPKRTRLVSSDLFQSVLKVGNRSSYHPK